jgi:prolyl-tRNA editing enzyme YbaK/EbsC (Cys-tRNA(Pro) deacylase)
MVSCNYIKWYSKSMTVKLLPIIQTAIEEHSITHDILPCDPEFADTEAFCEKYGFSLEQSANTIIIASRKVEPVKYAVCVVLATTRLDVNKKVCQLMGIKKASFADAQTTTRLTGQMIGGVTAIGIRDFPIFIDSAVMRQEKVVMGGGNRSSKLVVKPTELLKLPNVEVIDGLARPKE